MSETRFLIEFTAKASVMRRQKIEKSVAASPCVSARENGIGITYDDIDVEIAWDDLVDALVKAAEPIPPVDRMVIRAVSTKLRKSSRKDRTHNELST